MPENLQPLLDYLRDLRANNNKQWFDQNRKRYDAVRQQFEDFVAELIVAFGADEDLTGVSAKDCIFRINRDVRFSPDKTPYKTNMGALIGKGGRKASARSYYIHIAPDNQSMVAGGLHSPTSKDLEKLRRKIAENSKSFKKILNSSEFVRYFGELQGETLKTAPQGYAKDHPDIALLRFKQYLAARSFRDEQIAAPDIVSEVVETFRALKPFVGYIQVALEK